MRFPIACVLIGALLSGVPVSADPPQADARARRVFRLATIGDPLVLAHDAVLRLPGTSRERALAPAGSRLEDLQRTTVRSPDGPVDLLLWSVRRGEEAAGGFGDEVAVLAAFPAGQEAPTDVVEVKLDRFTAFGELPWLSIGTGDAFAIRNTHHNAGQPYLIEALFHVVGGRIRRIAEVQTLGESSGCGNAFTETLTWHARPGKGPWATVVARVDLVRAPADAQTDCEPPHPPERRTRYEGTFAWDATARRYRPAGGTLDQLAAWNEKRF
ncbi:hypothetical protein TBR22_A23370 [Luteitalea sp. TBR-22]|uniref:hypothetical protein n=1 Tax=Luteitalea sp. TBR-22 TaxID=2802971 RepID=UPI001AF5E96E|nr:hypothetical protein [Luteitalea sp. TBR-22]BCS33111.1 hypothetical protein TBR22_A23370 [Luteitalea sp. TBR-22]